MTTATPANACNTGTTVADTQSPFWLYLNGDWVPLPGVAPAISVARARPRSEFVSVGGYRHAQQARRGPRTWSLNFEHATPEAVAALQVAAEASGGEVLLFDRAAAAANMLNPLTTYAQTEFAETLPVSGGLPLRAFGAPSVLVDRVATSNVSTSNDDQGYADTLFVSVSGPFAYRGLLKFEIPVFQTNVISAELLFSAYDSDGPDLSVHVTSTDWVEATGFWPGGYAYPVDGPLQGTIIAIANGPNSLVLDPADVLAAGRSLGLSLSVASGQVAVRTRTEVSPPTLRLTLENLAEIPTTHTRLRAGQDYVFRCWTDAAPGESVATLTSPDSAQFLGGLGIVTAPPGSGPREVTQVLATDVGAGIAPVLNITPTYSTDYAVTGLQLTEGVDPPYGWMQGQHTCIPVEIVDPERARSLIWTPGGLGYGDWTVTLSETASAFSTDTFLAPVGAG